MRKLHRYLCIIFMAIFIQQANTLTIEIPVVALCLCTMDIELDGDMDIITGHGWAIGNIVSNSRKMILVRN